MNKEIHTLLFTDDFSRVQPRPALLATLFQFLHRRAALRLADRASNGRSGLEVVSSADLEEPMLEAGHEFLPYGSAMLQGVHEASARELVPFFDHVRACTRPAYRLQWGRGDVCAGDVVLLRHVVAFLLEYLLKPTAALRAVIHAAKPQRVVVTSARSPLESMAATVARSAGLPVEQVRAGLFIRALSWLKTTLARPSSIVAPEVVRDQWSRDYSLPPAPLAGGARYDAVIFCEEERRLNRAVELAGRLAELGRSALIVAAPFKEEAVRRAKALRASGVKLVLLPDFLSAAERERIFPLALEDAANAWHRLDSDPATRNFRCAGVEVWREFGPRLEPAWCSLHLVGSFAASAASRCLEQVSPSELILADNGLYSQAFLAVARSRGLSATWYCDNPILANVRFWSEVLPRYFPANAVIATSKFLRDGLERSFGYAAEKVFLLGESLSHVPKEASSPLQIAGSRPRVLALSAYVAIDVSARRRRQFHELVAKATELAGYDLVVRAHPNENLEGLRADLAAWGIRPVFLSQKENIQEVLAQVSAACMIFSQAGIEVLRGEQPLFAVQSGVEREAYESFIPYVGSGAAVGVDLELDAPESVAERLRACISDPRARSERLERGRAFFRAYSTAEFDPKELERFGRHLGPRA